MQGTTPFFTVLCLFDRYRNKLVYDVQERVKKVLSLFGSFLIIASFHTQACPHITLVSSPAMQSRKSQYTSIFRAVGSRPLECIFTRRRCARNNQFYCRNHRVAKQWNKQKHSYSVCTKMSVNEQKRYFLYLDKTPRHEQTPSGVSLTVTQFTPAVERSPDKSKRSEPHGTHVRTSKQTSANYP